MADPAPFRSVREFLLEAPLYTPFLLNDDREAVRMLYGQPGSGARHLVRKIDGYCPSCKRDTTFTLTPASLLSADEWANISTRSAFDRIGLTCARSDHHYLYFTFLIQRLTVTKVGQYPSLADIAIDETRQKYRSVLRGENWSEVYKAIGLAAHGEGIGAFVYLRRVFERLIRSRFDEFKSSEGWSDDDFERLRMDEKILFLKNHLPPYLIEIRKIYGIFSKGIHELENDACLQFFEVGKQSIVMVLQDDLKKQEELAARKELAAAVRKFGSDGQPGPAVE